MKLIPAALFLISTAALDAQDMVTLASGETLRGNILSIAEDSTISLKHPGAKKPLKINAKQTKRLDLNSEGKKITGKPSSIIALTNGDTIPGTINSIDDTKVAVSSSVVGDFTVDRNKIKYISFGTSVMHPIYKFNNTLTPFNINSGWVVNKNVLESQQTSLMWQKFPLTDNFIVRCDIEWTTNPQLTFHLAAQRNSAAMSNHKYQLLFQDSGITMSLHHKQMRSQPQSARKKLRDYTRRKVAVEIWVSQSKGNVTLFLDGSKVHNFSYPLTPSGNYIGLQNSSASGKVKVKNFTIATWDGKQTPRSSGHFGSAKNDIIIAKNDTKFSGKLLSTSEEEGEKLYKVSYEHSITGEQSIAEKNIQVIQFASAVNPKHSNLKASSLEGGSQIKLSNIRIANDVVSGRHSILGDVAIPKKYFTFLELNH